MVDRRAAAERKRKMEEKKEGIQKLDREEVSTVSGGAGGGGSSTFTVVFTSIQQMGTFCKMARYCEGTVTVTQGSESADGKHLLQLMRLAENRPATVTLSNPSDRVYLSDF